MAATNKKLSDDQLHLVIIDHLINNGFTFIEDNLIYTITAKNGQKAVYFARTGIVQISAKNFKTQSLDDLIEYLK